MKDKNRFKPLPEFTKYMSIEIEDIPKEKVLIIAEDIGNILMKHKIKFNYGGIGEGSTDKICGISFANSDRR